MPVVNFWSRGRCHSHVRPSFPLPLLHFLAPSPPFPLSSPKPTFQIRARTKRPPRPRNDPNPQSRLLIKPFPHRIQLDVSRIIDAIQRFRSVEGDEEDVPGGGVGEDGLGGGRWGGGELRGRHGVGGEGGGGMVGSGAEGSGVGSGWGWED